MRVIRLIFALNVMAAGSAFLEHSDSWAPTLHYLKSAGLWYAALFGVMALFLLMDYLRECLKSQTPAAPAAS